MKPDKNIVIIGGGLGGLVCGAILSKEGYGVTVVEKNAKAGGCLQSYSRFGAIFDTGMHVFGGMNADGNIRRICRYLGIEDSFTTIDFDTDSTAEVFFGQDKERYAVSLSGDRFVDSLSSIFPSQRAGLERYKDAVGRVMEDLDLFHLRSTPRMPVPRSEDFLTPADAFIGKYITDARTLCALDAPVILESIEFPDPVIQVAVEPKSKADQDKMGVALQKLAEEDPSFRVETNVETGETVISGMGELHLDVLVDRMKREFKVEANVGAPQVSYRETFRAATKAEGKFVRQSGGKGQYGHVWVEFTPNEEGKGFEFENAIVGGVVPREYIPAVEKGLEDSMNNGVLAGYPLVDIKAKLYDGSYHDVDSNETAFRVAASMALKAAAKNANPVILEPMMKVTITVPEDYLGDIMGHVTSRRGRVEGMEAHGNSQIVNAMVPLAEMFGYATTLRSATQGRGTFMMVFDHYEDVPKSVQEEIIKKNGGNA